MRQHPFLFGSWEAISLVCTRMRPLFAYESEANAIFYSSDKEEEKLSCQMPFCPQSEKNYQRFGAIVITKSLSIDQSAALLKCNKSLNLSRHCRRRAKSTLENGKKFQLAHNKAKVLSFFQQTPSPCAVEQLMLATMQLC
jgi:hypothetical protein